MGGYGDIEIKSNSKFLKIESGTPHDIRLLDDAPTVKLLHGFGKEATECIGEGCELCIDPAEGEEAKQRFSSEVYDHLLKRKLTWDYGPGIAKQLKAIDVTLAEEGKKITDVDIKVAATGSMMAKKYTCTPRMTSKPIPDDVKTPF